MCTSTVNGVFTLWTRWDCRYLYLSQNTGCRDKMCAYFLSVVLRPEVLGWLMLETSVRGSRPLRLRERLYNIRVWVNRAHMVFRATSRAGIRKRVCVQTNWVTGYTDKIQLYRICRADYTSLVASISTESDIICAHTLNNKHNTLVLFLKKIYEYTQYIFWFIWCNFNTRM